MPTSNLALTPLDPGMVGPYRLVRRIGRGGMGEVWLGQHEVSGTLGAVKRLDEDRHRERLAGYAGREGKAVLRLDHPHVVPVLDVGADYLVTAYVEGGDLARRLHTPIDPMTAIRLARQIADALEHAHRRGVVHRDVKPSNILVDGNGNAYLADFGLALLADDTDTPAGKAAGTPQFMAPEQRRGGRVEPSADQYALGRTLLEMLVGGKVPVDREAALDELPAYLPASLRDVIARATAASPGERFPSMAAFGAALAAIELADVGPPRRFAALVRDAEPFAWLGGAVRVTDVGPDLVRADHRLRALGEAGLLPATEVDELLARAGLTELGFSVWGSRGRLGAITDPVALARASDLVILLHGWGHDREVWGAIARAICRDNARAVVLTPDIHGFGESTFAGTPTIEQASPLALARVIDDWRRLLQVAVIPTAMVGHSMSGFALLSVDDDGAGVHVARIAINPVLASHDAAVRKRFRRQARLAATIGRIGPLRRFAIRFMGSRAAEQAMLAPEAVQTMIKHSSEISGGAIAQVLRALAGAPARLGRQRRAALIVCDDDPWIDQDALARAIADIELDPAHVHRLPYGGHHPHVESAAHPEWSARNLIDIVRIIDAMLVTAGESESGNASPLALESTMPVQTMPG